MKKVLIDVEINTNDVVKKMKLKGIFDVKRNILTYDEEDGTKVKLDINENKLERENDEILMILTFSLTCSNEGLIILKENKQNIRLNLLTHLIDLTEYFYHVCYEIEGSQKIDYKIAITK